MMTLERFSIGIGDRFARQGEAQLRAFILAAENGVNITPVWNKSNREHKLVGTQPASVRAEADAAVKALGWTKPYRVDADHIALATVDGFIEASDFFTIDVADQIGHAAPTEDIDRFIQHAKPLLGTLRVPGIEQPLDVTPRLIEQVARKYVFAVREAGRIFRHIEQRKGAGRFIAEVSMDETDSPQTPPELLLILLALSKEGVAAQTIAPRFSGRFNKGIDYVGAVGQFAREFADDLAVIAYATKQFGLPANLKLSVHSGSDKFSLYPVIRRAVADSGAGLHLKTAGTTWLEELIGLALGEGDGLRIAKDVYAQAFSRYDELVAPYASVVDIDLAALPSPDEVSRWNGERFAEALRHDPSCPRFDRNFRQLLHVAFRVAAEMKDRYLQALDGNRAVIAENVTGNLFDRHIRPLFLDKD